MDEDDEESFFFPSDTPGPSGGPQSTFLSTSLGKQAIKPSQVKINFQSPAAVVQAGFRSPSPPPTVQSNSQPASSLQSPVIQSNSFHPAAVPSSTYLPTPAIHHSSVQPSSPQIQSNFQPTPEEYQSAFQQAQPLQSTVIQPNNGPSQSDVNGADPGWEKAPVITSVSSGLNGWDSLKIPQVCSYYQGCALF